MIPKHLTVEQLLGRLCCPVHRMRNTTGSIKLTPDTICRIESFSDKSDSFTIRTEKCPNCHEYTYLSGISRKDLKLVGIVELVERDSAHGSLQCGQTCWVVERDEDGEACELGGYIFIAQIPGYTIVAPTLNGSDDVKVLMDDQVQQTAEDYHGDLAVFPAQDVYAERQKAQEALDNATKEK